MIESSPITTKQNTGSYSVFNSMVFRLPLPLILLLQAITSLLTLRNTAFQDEALYLLAGQQIFLSWMGKTPYLEPYGLYFSGYPSFYPVIGGVLDFLGGLEAARLFSLLCMLIVTTCVYFMTIQFFDRKSALIAAFLFASEGSVLFLGRLATYDAFCLCLLALAVMLSLRSSKAASAQTLLALGPLLSLDKHLAFSMFFLAPLAGFAIASLVGLWQKRFVHSVRLSWFTALALCLLTFPLGLQQSRNLYQGWPPSTQLTTLLRPRVRQGIGHYLAEDFDVLRYNLKDETDIWQWTSLDYFVYTDKAGHDLSGEAAYTAAIREGYFDLIELSYGYHTPLAMQIDQNLTASKLYDLVARIPIHSSYGDGYFWLWSKHAGEPGSAETVVCKAICAWKIELNPDLGIER